MRCPLAKGDVGGVGPRWGKERRVRRGQVGVVAHGEVDDVMTPILEQAPGVEKRGLRSRPWPEELVDEKHAHAVRRQAGSEARAVDVA